mmetsp:Transcript_31592/g.39306  ORF Transcript_31592/g.39306 Transcript_31592/m.39306 type:complete len:96 (+) Transcript_31592:191-478(+)
MKANLRIMDHIIRKYRPPKQRDMSEPAKMNSDQIYESLECGLENIAQHLTKLSCGAKKLNFSDVRAPQKKLYVMVIGNHSAGKSSFINWYIGEKL